MRRDYQAAFLGEHMNNKVYASLFWLTFGSILLCYALKFFFPEMFLLAIENPRLLAIGNYIDGNPIAYFMCGLATSFLTYWLYICACCGIKRLTMRQSFALFMFLVASHFVYAFDLQIGMHVAAVSMLAFPAVIGCNSKDLVFVYGVHYGAQALSLAIKNQLLNVDANSYLAFMVLSMDAYLWLILLYVISINRKGKEFIWDGLCPLFMGRINCFWKKKSALLKLLLRKPKP